MKLIKFQYKTQNGFTLLEVVLAIAVFAFGMLALIELQTNLARSGSDANTRTVAVNIAEELVERARGFTQIEAIADNGRVEYDEIVSSFDTVPRANLDYSVNVIVNEFYWDAVSESFTNEAPVGIVNSDFKTMDILVMWRERFEEESLADHETIDLRKGGAVRVVEVLPSSPSLLGALLAADKESGGTPPVNYTPGENPDIIALKLFDDGEVSKFKESTTALPSLVRGDHIETWFDVVTYSQVAGNASFLRREEFVAVACTCELETTPEAADYGLKPTLWNGVTYTEGEKVNKPIGIAANNVTQSEFCGICCRDHHDGAGNTDEDVYNRVNAGGADADHPHYARDIDNRGNATFTLAGDGDRYVEACRLVRHNGFMRVTQDANQATLLGFPEGYLEFDDGAQAYSAYVVDAVGEYYGNSQALFEQPDPPDPASPHQFPAREGGVGGDATTLPTAWLTDQQQLRARAIYTDYLTSAAQTVIDDCFPRTDDGPRTENCAAPYASSELEIYPFFDLQMTFLARWPLVNDSGQIIGNSNNVVEVTNDAIVADTNEYDGIVPYSRGLAALISGEGGQTRVGISSRKGNLGLTATPSIDPGNDETWDYLYINSNLLDATIPPIGVVVSGGLNSELNRVSPSDLGLTSDTALCGQSDTEWSCVVPAGGASLTVSGYYLRNPRTYVCSTLPFAGESDDLNSTTFTLPGTAGTFNIWVTDDASNCAGL
jgi:prepilin-type N-terminal cleavage/methylation domain-containing protein